MLLQKYKYKQFLCGHCILTEGVLVVRESQFDELFALRQMAVSYEICITCCKTSSEFYLHSLFTYFL
jgi:hypothetical protein